MRISCPFCNKNYDRQGKLLSSFLFFFLMKNIFFVWTKSDQIGILWFGWTKYSIPLKKLNQKSRDFGSRDFLKKVADTLGLALSLKLDSRKSPLCDDF